MSAGRSYEWLESLGKVGQGRKSGSPGEKFQVIYSAETAAGDESWQGEDWEKTLLQERTDSRKGAFL